MALTVSQFKEGRLFNAETVEEQNALVSFYQDLERYEDLRSNPNRKRFRRAWIKIERLLQEELPRVSGIDREEIFK